MDYVSFSLTMYITSKHQTGRPTPTLSISSYRNAWIAQQQFLGKLPLAASCATPTLWINTTLLDLTNGSLKAHTKKSSCSSFLLFVYTWCLECMRNTPVRSHWSLKVRDRLIITQTNCILLFRHPQDGGPSKTTRPNDGATLSWRQLVWISCPGSISSTVAFWDNLQAPGYQTRGR